MTIQYGSPMHIKNISSIAIHCADNLVCINLAGYSYIFMQLLLS